ncbi:flavin reductase family protein [Pollutimonas bauzanensis]|uniref:NADH-FMN oxidoreductase RutF, flavin reductase (DIM6/NTAB) family n=1 Tax=Pollutimonas bauzanensis TaxID=658167 RepID=A0A1M5WZI3_9BURK|nr:flavin reductase family protein [Pollutimonas bauzanensis]SHH92708.1 NADH-FMN oxidoreductase RutF, flavin reductase (DIM6/NTAB) family [Pollutimonas bauzanensis]
MTATPPDFDADFFRSALGRFATGVTIITAETCDDRRPVGLTISSFNSVSLQPPMVLWSLSNTASSLRHFLQAERYVIHVLAATQLHLAKRFAHGPQAARFAGLALQRAPGGTLMLDDPECAAWFECCNLTQHEAGDHLIFIGQVERCQRNFNQPLVYHAGDFDLTPSTEPLSND